MRKEIENYLETILSKNTRVTYSTALKQFTDYLEKSYGKDVNVSDVRYSDVKKYVIYLKDEKGYKKSTINQKIFAIISFFDCLVKDNVIKENVAKGFEEFKVDPSAEIFLTKEESNKLLDFMKNLERKKDERCFELRKSRDTFFIALLINTGIRISEALSLDINSIKPNGHFKIYDTKNHSDFETFISKNVMELYEEYLKVREEFNPQTDKLFISKDGISMEKSKSYINRKLKDYCKKAGVKEISPHKLRHTSAYLFLENGGNIRALQKHLNHASALTTEKVYSHTTVEDRKKYSNVI